MPGTKEIAAGDVCPIDGGAFVVDAAHDPETLIDRHGRNAQSAFVAARFAERVREKTEELGVIHKCMTCGYQARFKAANGDAGGAGASDDAGGEGGEGEAAAGAAAGAGRGGRNRARGH